jgi:predicted secreted protein
MNPDERNKRDSDELRLHLPKSAPDDARMLIVAVAQGLIALVVVGGAFYYLMSGGSLPDTAWQLIALVVGAFFGLDAVSKFMNRR